MDRNTCVQTTRKIMHKILKDLRTRCLSADDLPTPDFLEYLRCSACKDYIVTRPVQVFIDNMRFLCGECTEPEDEPRLVLLPQSYLARIRFPCKFESSGCGQMPHFGMSWVLHTVTCVHNREFADCEEQYPNPEQFGFQEGPPDIPVEALQVDGQIRPRRIMWRNVITDYFRRTQDEEDNDDEYREDVYQERLKRLCLPH